MTVALRSFDKSQTPYTSPVAVESYGRLAATLLSLGVVLLAAFFQYEMQATRETRSLTRELPLAVVSSFLLGFGGLFAALWAGLWV